MLGKAFSLLKGNAKPLPAMPAPRLSGDSPAGLARMVSSAGRISLSPLQRMAQAASREVFVRFMQAPVLVGSAIHLGTLTAVQAGSGSGEMNRTILFEPAVDTELSVSPSESLQHAIYPLVKGEHANSVGNFFSIGRIDGNDLIMPDYAISKNHAVIEVRRGAYLVKDTGSTNGTRLNGSRLQAKPVEIHDRDVISFARYEFTFFLPDSLYDSLKGA